MTLTTKQLLILKAIQVSYRKENGGIGLGYQLPSTFAKVGRSIELIIYVNRGNGYHPENVTQVWGGSEVYLNAVKGNFPE